MGGLNHQQQALVKRFLGGCVQSAGCFVGKYPSRFFEQDPRNGQTLLLAPRQFLSPGIGFIQPLGELGQQGIGQCDFQLIVGVAGGGLRVGQSIAQRPVREIGALRDKHGSKRFADVPAGKGPDACDGAKQGGFAAARRALQQNAVACLRLQMEILQQDLAIGQSQRQIFDVKCY